MPKDDKQFDPTPDVSVADEAMPTADVQTALRRLGYVDAKPVRLNLSVDLSPASMTGGYAPRIVHDLVLNTTPQRVTLKLLTASLIAHKAELCDGTRITRNVHAMQWLLEQLAIRLPSPLLDQLMEGAES